MLGKTHIVSGLLTWGCIAYFDNLHYSILSNCLYGLIVAGSSLIPDIDISNSTISSVLFPLTHWSSNCISRIFGHRSITHSLFGIVVFIVVTYYINSNILNNIILILALSSSICNMFSFLFFRSSIILSILNYLLIAYIMFFNTIFDYRLIYLVYIGMVVHIVGDILSGNGCKLLWPFNGRLVIPIIKHVGNGFEIKIVYPLLIVLSCIIYIILFTGIKQ